MRRKKDQRRQDVVRQFEAGRNAAQYQAALSFLSQGNSKAGRQSLEQVLARDPEHYDARLTLVDLLLDDEEYDAGRESTCETFWPPVPTMLAPNIRWS